MMAMVASVNEDKQRYLYIVRAWHFVGHIYIYNLSTIMTYIDICHGVLADGLCALTCWI